MSKKETIARLPVITLCCIRLCFVPLARCYLRYRIGDTLPETWQLAVLALIVFILDTLTSSSIDGLHPAASQTKCIFNHVLGLIYGVLHLFVLYSITAYEELHTDLLNYILQAFTISCCGFAPLVGISGWRVVDYFFCTHENDPEHLLTNATCVLSLVLPLISHFRPYYGFPLDGMLGSLFGYWLASGVTIALLLLGFARGGQTAENSLTRAMRFWKSLNKLG